MPRLQTAVGIVVLATTIGCGDERTEEDVFAGNPAMTSNGPYGDTGTDDDDDFDDNDVDDDGSGDPGDPPSGDDGGPAADGGMDEPPQPPKGLLVILVLRAAFVGLGRDRRVLLQRQSHGCIIAVAVLAAGTPP